MFNITRFCCTSLIRFYLRYSHSPYRTPFHHLGHLLRRRTFNRPYNTSYFLLCFLVLFPFLICVCSHSCDSSKRGGQIVEIEQFSGP